MIIFKLNLIFVKEIKKIFSLLSTDHTCLFKITFVPFMDYFQRREIFQSLLFLIDIEWFITIKTNHFLHLLVVITWLLQMGHNKSPTKELSKSHNLLSELFAFPRSLTANGFLLCLWSIFRHSRFFHCALAKCSIPSFPILQESTMIKDLQGVIFL